MQIVDDMIDCLIPNSEVSYRFKCKSVYYIRIIHHIILQSSSGIEKASSTWMSNLVKNCVVYLTSNIVVQRKKSILRSECSVIKMLMV